MAGAYPAVIPIRRPCALRANAANKIRRRSRFCPPKNKSGRKAKVTNIPD
jgi:hypothetical protein